MRKIECLRVKWESTGRPVKRERNSFHLMERIETIEDISIL